MNAARLALSRAEHRLLERLAELEARLGPGLDSGAWIEYGALVQALAAIAPATAPGSNGELLTTEQLAARLQISERQIRRRTKDGKLKPVRLGARTVRWPAGAAR